MTDFNLKDDELNDILGLSSSAEYIPTFMTKNVQKLPFLTESEDLDSLSSVADINDSDDEMSPQSQLPTNNLSMPKSDEQPELKENMMRKESVQTQSATNGPARMTAPLTQAIDPPLTQSLAMDHISSPGIDQTASTVGLERLLLKLEENSDKVIHEFKQEIIKSLNERQDLLQKKEEQLDLMMREIQLKHDKNVEKETSLLELEKSLLKERSELKFQKEQFQTHKEILFNEKDKQSHEFDLEKSRLLQLEQELKLEHSNHELKIAQDQSKLEREKAQLEFDRKILLERESQVKRESSSELETFRHEKERSLFDKENAMFLNKLSEYHLNMGKLRIQKQELDALEIQLKAEKEIISIKESEISSNLGQITILKNEITRERETMEKLVQDNYDLCKKLEFQKISIENAQRNLMIDRANALQKRLDFGDDYNLGQMDALRLTSNIPIKKPVLSSKEKSVNTEHMRLKMQLEAARIKQVWFDVLMRQTENLILQRRQLSSLLGSSGQAPKIA